MLNFRVIPTLLLKDRGLVKGKSFKNHRYVGDPINVVKILNEKEVDEIAFLDISATSSGRGPNYALIKRIASEAFMPFSYGGGITNVTQAEDLFKIGVEKVIVNTAANNSQFIEDLVRVAGSQSVCISIDYKRSFFGRYEVYCSNASLGIGFNPIDYAKKMEDLGVGELMLCSIDREGTKKGYDLYLTKQVSDAVSIPVIASGGAGELKHMKEAVEVGGASAVAAGSFFIFHGPLDAVLVTYPSHQTLINLFKDIRDE